MASEIDRSADEVTHRRCQIRPGEERKLQVDLKPGTYAVICDVAGHKEAGMVMQLVVK